MSDISQESDKLTLCRSVDRWLLANPQLRNKPLALVLHTSCVNYSMECFQRFRRQRLPMILPNNVAWELRLLQKSQHYGKRARFLLECACEASNWDLEQLYEHSNAPIAPRQIFNGNLLFLFGDLNKQDEFLNHATDHPACYIMVNPTWLHNSDELQVCPLGVMRKCAFRDPVPLTPSSAAPNITTLPQIRCTDASRASVSGADFRTTGQSGAYSCIYTHPAFPDQLLKIYRQADQPGCRVQTGTYSQKLRYMQRYHQSVRLKNIAFPEHLLTNDRQQVLGYSMRHCHGVPLRQYIITGWKGKTEAEMGQILQNLMLLLLEIHNRHMLAGDLSCNNILVDQDNQVYLVDCDSFQFHQYPGGTATSMYKHPEVALEKVTYTLREPRHEYFALAVLLFQCLMYDDPLPQQSASMPSGWEHISFPLDIQGTHFPDVHPFIEEIWCNTDINIRRLFSDELHLRCDHSLGAWIRALELTDDI